MEKKADLKSMSTKEKISYIWDYYHWPFIIGAAIIIVIVSLVVQYVSYEEPILNVVMINCNDSVNSTDIGYRDFLIEHGYEVDDHSISLTSTLNFEENNQSTTMYDRQTLTMLLYSGGQDLFLGTGDVYLEYAKQGVLMDLTTVLSESTLEKYEDQLIYYTDEEDGTTYPCAIELTDNAWVKKYDYYDTCYFGIPWQAANLEIATEFAEMLLNEY